MSEHAAEMTKDLQIMTQWCNKQFATFSQKPINDTMYNKVNHPAIKICDTLDH